MSDRRDDIFPTTPRTPPRTPEPEASVHLEFGSFREFIDEYSQYISEEGIFVMGTPSEVGEEVAFEVRLSDDFRLIHGAGRVEWTVPAGTPGREPGMALRFTRLDDPSRRLVARLVDNHRSSGGEPFDIERPLAPPPVAAADEVAEEPELGAAARLPGEVGTETIALPISLSGLAVDRPAEEGATGGIEEVAPVAADALEDDAEDRRLAPPPMELDAELPVDEVAPPLPSMDSGFEPADLSDPTEDAGLDDRATALPVMPVEPEPPEAGVLERPGEGRQAAGAVAPEPPSLGGEEPMAAPSEPEPIAAPVAPRQPVEMPDEEDLAADYYRTVKAPRRASTFLWVALCLLAIALGAAAWRYQDAWIDYLPASLRGAEAVAARPSAAPPPAVDTDPIAAGAGGGESEPRAAEPPVPAAPAAFEEPARQAAEPPAVAAGEPTAAPAEEPAVTEGEAGGEEAPPAAGEALAAEPPATEAPVAAAAFPTRVESITSRQNDGVTLIEIVADRPLAPAAYEVVRVATPPARQVIKIFGPSAPYGRDAIAVGSPHLHRLRTGFHRGARDGEIHVVADLTGPDVRVTGVEARGATLVITLGSP